MNKLHINGNIYFLEQNKRKYNLNYVTLDVLTLEAEQNVLYLIQSSYLNEFMIVKNKANGSFTCKVWIAKSTLALQV